MAAQIRIADVAVVAASVPQIRIADVAVVIPHVPTVVLSAAPSMGNLGIDVQFDAGTDVGRTFDFNFGDGTTVTGISDSSPDHIYTTAGTFTATVTMHDAATGLTATASTAITVTAVRMRRYFAVMGSGVPVPLILVGEGAGDGPPAPLFVLGAVQGGVVEDPNNSGG